MNKELLQCATNEALYWWIRDEYYYHKIFSNLNTIYKDDKQLEFFSSYLFQPFVRQYSVHRTLKKIKENKIELLRLLNKANFYGNVVEGNTGIIDFIASNLPDKYKNGKPISFLSKFAFLINPKEFSLYDSFARNALNKIRKHENKDNKAIKSSYSDFISFLNMELQINRSEILSQSKLLEKFSQYSGVSFLEINIEVFIRRVYDKYLWLYNQKENEKRGLSDSSTVKAILKYYGS